MEFKSEASYGQMLVDRHHLLKQPANATICTKIDAHRFKALLKRLLS